MSRCIPSSALMGLGEGPYPGLVLRDKGALDPGDVIPCGGARWLWPGDRLVDENLGESPACDGDEPARLRETERWRLVG